MSAANSAITVFNRTVADLDTVLGSSEGWRDDQRSRLERAQLGRCEPKRTGSWRRYVSWTHPLTQLSDSSITDRDLEIAEPPHSVDLALIT